MIKILFSIIFLGLINLSETDNISLKIVITNLESNSGKIVMDFRDENDNTLKHFSEKIENKECVIIVKDLKPGKYAFKYFHDENSNNKIDTYWIGVPKEGIGFSNNAEIKFGPPDFDETVFEIKNNATIVCKAHYFKF